MARLVLGHKHRLLAPFWGLALAPILAGSAACGARSKLDLLEPSSSTSHPAAGGHSSSGTSSSSGAGGASGALPGAGAGGAQQGGVDDGGGAGGSETTPGYDIPAATSGARLHAQLLSTPDGVRLFVGFFDTQLGQPCQLRSMPDRQVLCVPTDAQLDTDYDRDGKLSGSSAYSDPACTKPVLPADGWQCRTPPKYVVTTLVHTTEGAKPTSCDDPDWQLREVGGQIELQDVYYVDQNKQCNKSAGTSARFFEESQPLPHSIFALAKERTRDMPSRLRVREWVGEDGSRQVLGWYDSRRKEPCAFTQTQDGTNRCLPVAQGYGNYYADAACTEPVADISGFYSRIDCNTPPPKYLAGVDGGDCQFIEQLFKPGDPVPAGTQILYGVGQCNQFWSTASDDHPFLRLGEPIASSSFASLHTVWVGRGRLREESYANDEGFTIPARSAIPVDQWSVAPRFADTDRQEYCSFQATEDGLQRCVPLSFVIEDWSPRKEPKPPTGFSLDPLCASPDLTHVRRHYCAPIEPPQYLYPDAPKSAVTTVQLDDCNSAVWVWSVPEPHHPASEPVYWVGREPTPMCAKLAAGLDYFANIGTRIPSTAFEAAVLVTE